MNKTAEARKGLSAAGTPFLALEPERMERNILRLGARLDRLGVPLRPHVKTPKSAEVALRMGRGRIQPLTVSTLREAEVFADAGFTDQIYAVGIAPAKLDRVARLRARGVDIAVLLDSVAQAETVVEASRRHGRAIPALIEIDSDGHRSGLAADDPLVETIARLLAHGAEARGVLVHAGGSYACRTPAALATAAEAERSAAVTAAERIRATGLAAPVVSVGSTPTAHFATSLDGVTEVRAGVYVFMDLVMAGIGVCAVDDIAISVIATVIGRREDRGWIITDAGWMALSRDRGTATQEVDQGFGLVAAMDGSPFPGLIVSATSQEHGILSIRPGSTALLPKVRVGERVRILPNHACATAAQFDRYHILPTGSDHIMEEWPRFQGW